MEHRASLFAQRPLGYFASTLFLLMVAALLSAHAYVAGMTAIGVGAAFVVRLRARRMVFGEDSFRYDGWFRTIRIPYAGIQRVVRAEAFGYPIDRLRAGNHCIVTNHAKYWVGLAWFSPQANRTFAERFIRKKPYVGI